MGLDVYLKDGEKEVEEKSKKHPEHYSNRGYLRSSYNDMGFNRVAKILTGMDLYTVFEPIEDGEDEFYISYSKEHLLAALERARELTKKITEAPPFYVETVSPVNMFNPKPKEVSGEEAVAQFRKKYEEYHANGKGMAAYSNSEGTFFMEEPLKVHAMMPGVDIFGAPCIHLVHEFDHTYYIQQAEIVEEFIEHALTLEDPRIGWSG